MAYKFPQVVPLDLKPSQAYNLYSNEDWEKIKHLKAKKGVKIYFENDRFIIYTYKVNNVEISVNFNTKPLIEWSKEQLKGVLVNG